MNIEQTREAIARARKEARDIRIESSGGINLENVRAYAEAGSQFISVGHLTHSVQAVGIAMRMQPV